MSASAGFASLGSGLHSLEHPLWLSDGFSADGVAGRLLRAIRSRDEASGNRGAQYAGLRSAASGRSGHAVLESTAAVSPRLSLPAVAEGATAFGWWLLGLLRQLRARPQILRHPEAVRLLETDLIYWLATTVYPHTWGLVRIRQPRRTTGLDRALDYLRNQRPGRGLRDRLNPYWLAGCTTLSLVLHFFAGG